VEPRGDAELLSLVLGSGGGGAPLTTLSAALLDDHGGVGGLLRTGIGELAARRGMGPTKAARLTAALELGRRAIAAASIECAPRLPDHRAVFAWGQSKLGILDHEELWVLALAGFDTTSTGCRIVGPGLLHRARRCLRAARHAFAGR
jgi:DNA repair protein RadC